uniref:Leucine-rich repeat-containing N-terminal plant-type domain-containing protein n=1 Tax=Fagus sylvatica TaxID=28930 RepID=A0A2N9FP38_FAGSY
MKSWKADSDCCSWDGVTCDPENGHVVGLNLTNSWLNGRLNSNSTLFSLRHLHKLNLALNNFSSSTIPSQFGHLARLTHLNLSRSFLSGQIPSEISWLSNLVSLDLSYNYFKYFVGGPDDFKDLNLRRIDLEALVQNMTYLRELHLDEVNISSSLPQSLANLSSLTSLSLSWGSLLGEFPSNTFVLPKIQAIDLTYNEDLAGFLPKFRSVLPWKNMISLDLRSNKLQGSLPIPPLSTQYFFASNNNLTGRIPSLICKVNSLQVLDLSNNHLIGQIPQCLGNFSSSLSVLNMRSNNFQGILPETFIKGSSLRTLDVSLNRIEGKIPRSLVKCRLLEVLNLGNNIMNDIFPFWLESLPELKILILRANGFQGPIWDSHTNFGFSKLHVIDLSHNNFSGRLPSEYFKTWNAMLMVHGKINSKPEYMADHSGYYEDSITVMNKGLEMELVKILTIFIAIDLSNNRFCGEIPNTMGNLKELIVLNLSRNSFTGPIPSSFGNLIELQSLDLSQNKFLGEIPQQLISLTFLAYLNLSQNQLIGPIPQGGQFWTFQSSSFEGNLELCGSPLLMKCENNETPISTLSYESSFGEGFNWKAVVIGYACGLVIGLLIGHVVISRRAHWFMKTFRVKLHR